MPTGYTSDIAKGISFKQYALNCARAFGALIEMRDEPADTPIPNEFKPSSYHLKAINKARSGIARINKMTLNECELKAAKSHKERKNRIEKAIKANVKLKAKYKAMLAEVDKYKSPSREHDEFARFMREQITKSIEFDCGGSYYHDELKNLRPKSGGQWKSETLKEFRDEIAYHTREHEKEVKRCADRTQWVNLLRKSLDIPA